MKRQDWSPSAGPLVAMACKCSIWPISTLTPIGRCRECGVKPLLIPPYEDLLEAQRC